MGEYADYAVEQMMDRWDSCERPYRRPAIIKTCNRCSEGNLRWGNVKGGEWRLKTPEGELHVCRPAIERVRDAQFA